MTTLAARDGLQFRNVGITDGGAPTAGSYVPGNWVIGTSDIFMCVKGGTPGTWTGLGATDPTVYAAIPGTPVVFTQTYATTATTVVAPTAAAHTYPASGNLFDAVAADLLINVRTDSLANAVADIVVNLKSLADNLNQAVADGLLNRQLTNSLIDGQQAAGIASAP